MVNNNEDNLGYGLNKLVRSLPMIGPIIEAKRENSDNWVEEDEEIRKKEKSGLRKILCWGIPLYATAFIASHVFVYGPAFKKLERIDLAKDPHRMSKSETYILFRFKTENVGEFYKVKVDIRNELNPCVLKATRVSSGEDSDFDAVLRNYFIRNDGELGAFKEFPLTGEEREEVKRRMRDYKDNNGKFGMYVPDEFLE